MVKARKGQSWNAFFRGRKFLIYPSTLQRNDFGMRKVFYFYCERKRPGNLHKITEFIMDKKGR